MVAVARKIRWYALYKGDKFLYQGTKQDLAKYLGVSEDTIYFYTTPAYKRRFADNSNKYLVIKVDDIDE